MCREKRRMEGCKNDLPDTICEDTFFDVPGKTTSALCAVPNKKQHNLDVPGKRRPGPCLGRDFCSLQNRKSCNFFSPRCGKACRLPTELAGKPARSLASQPASYQPAGSQPASQAGSQSVNQPTSQRESNEQAGQSASQTASWSANSKADKPVGMLSDKLTGWLCCSAVCWRDSELGGKRA